MQNPTIQTAANDAAETSVTIAEISSSQTFLEAVLYKDAKTLRTFGVDDKAVQSITLDKQIEVAMKLLAADNNLRRSQSKRVQSATMLGDKKPSAPVTSKPSLAGKQAATFIPTPSKTTLKAV
ncbi:hypothetical protein MXM41_07400 [Leclercia adecarboxylata]|uniref:hypothetical protein n=1 Tax=Leclercia adecarboxylata TaxID=83655 RepID=UPI002DBF9E5D|nr:hypothetical protein [Leclercia adecarboxylata]MEB6378757.1 hypothetical protein [Leclercia adecarboxylata]